MYVTSRTCRLGPVATDDFDNDAQLDIVVVSGFDQSVDVLLGYGHLDFSSRTKLIIEDDAQPRAFATTDFNNDHQTDIVVVCSGVNKMNIFLGYANGYFANQTAHATGSFPSSVATEDFNNDIYIDIIVANFHSNNLGVFHGYGNGSFTNQTIYNTYFGAQFVVMPDFNNDLFLDIIMTIPDTNTVSILPGYGDGTFGDLLKFQLKYGSLPLSVCIGDFNNKKNEILPLSMKPQTVYKFICKRVDILYSNVTIFLSFICCIIILLSV